MKTVGERLEGVLRVLAAVPDERLDMNLWSCGTHACAAGHCASDSEFIEAGFYLLMSSDTSHRVPMFEDSVSYSAVESFFGLTGEEAYEVFHPGSYRKEYYDTPFNHKSATPVSAVVENVNILLSRLRLSGQASMTPADRLATHNGRRS